MATTQTKSLGFLMLFLVISFSSSSVQARPLRTFDEEAMEGIKDFIDGLSVWGVKSAGPSPGGKGHASTTIDALGGIKNSGPSPGQGHAQVISANHQ
ncbi:hypothetical protein QJS04_geneDACA001645 [Acorus gramineus]|uniref:Uncharacterized protein n=1 Tax=Acorus gramineus TaxID=55184 RepID=A0AAV9BG38_ACOGR|nr:hypothetical protein QJS04_geneDACA001645 [Acorus gramineus]